MAPLRRTTETPPRPTSRRGQDSWALITPGLDDSTAPMADECQFFLENVAAKFGCRQASRLDRRSCCVCYPHWPRWDDAQQYIAWPSKVDRQVLSAALSGMEVCSARLESPNGERHADHSASSVSHRQCPAGSVGAMKARAAKPVDIVVQDGAVQLRSDGLALSPADYARLLGRLADTPE